ncbi:Protein abhd14b [Bulinus truncatus]|nr:Protein abhd14b [Bulinus truncatus]
MGGIRPSGLAINKPVAFGILFVTCVIIFLYRHFFISSVAEEIKSVPKLAALSLPSLEENMLQEDFSEIEVSLKEKKLKIHVKQVIRKNLETPKLNVLFLHGMSFTSQNWFDIKTAYHVANWGYRAIAIDLPGRGKSLNSSVSEELKGEFLDALISKLGMSDIVIVAPSMSGSYALPYLFNDKSKESEVVKGFVPVAPVDTDKFESKFTKSSIPALIIYGANDKRINNFLLHLKKIPKHTVVEIKDAGHACYMDKPEEFHKALYSFLTELHPK